MKKGDFILVACALAVAAAVALFTFSSHGKTVTVKQNNAVVYSGSLYTDKTVKLPSNTVLIKDGWARMESADCKNHICIHTGKISKSGESIICLPNKVSVTIK